MSHWFAWFPGDFLRDTQHLSMVEDAAYRRILDHYYMVERVPSPSVADSASAAANALSLLRVCRAVMADEQEAVRKVAAEFFEERNGFLWHEKVERGIALSRALTEKRRAAGRKGAEMTNRKRSAHVAASDAASAVATAVASGSAIPQPHVNPIPTTSGACAPVPDPVFGEGLAFLVGKGMVERSARSFLGLLRKEHGDTAVVEAIDKAKVDDISDPPTWLRRYLASTPTSSRHRRPSAEDFAGVDYGTGGKI